MRVACGYAQWKLASEISATCWTWPLLASSTVVIVYSYLCFIEITSGQSRPMMRRSALEIIAQCGSSRSDLPGATLTSTDLLQNSTVGRSKDSGKIRMTKVKVQTDDKRSTVLRYVAVLGQGPFILLLWGIRKVVFKTFRNLRVLFYKWPVIIEASTRFSLRVKSRVEAPSCPAVSYSIFSWVSCYWR